MINQDKYFTGDGQASVPMLAALLCAAAVVIMGAGWPEAPDGLPAERPAVELPEFPEPALAPPPDGGRGRIIASRCEQANISYLLYQPDQRDSERSYPLVVWLTSKPADAISAADLARTWGESADRDRYLVLMPELTGVPAEDTRAVRELVAGVRQWHRIDAGAALLASEPTRKVLAAALLVTWGGAAPFVAIDGPGDVAAVLADEQLWPDLVQISIRPRRREQLPVQIMMYPIVAARVGRVESYRWELSSFDLPPSRLRRYCLVIHEPGEYPVSVTVRAECGREYAGRTIITAPTSVSRHRP